MGRMEMETFAKPTTEVGPGARENCCVYIPEALMEPTVGTGSFLCWLPTQAHLESELFPKHTLWPPLCCAQPKAPNSTWG